jgi:hypothetical protein
VDKERLGTTRDASVNRKSSAKRRNIGRKKYARTRGKGSVDLMNLLEEESRGPEGEASTQDSLDLQSLPMAHYSNLPASTLTRLCRQKFTALLTGLESGPPGHREWMHPTALETEHERLRIWSGSLGAMQAGHSSLDSRLRESTVILGNVVALLTDLYQALAKSKSIKLDTMLQLPDCIKVSKLSPERGYPWNRC